MQSSFVQVQTSYLTGWLVPVYIVFRHAWRARACVHRFSCLTGGLVPVLIGMKNNSCIVCTPMDMSSFFVCVNPAIGSLRWCVCVGENSDWIAGVGTQRLDRCIDVCVC